MKAEDEKDDEESKDTTEQEELTEEDLEAVQGGAKTDTESAKKQEDYLKLEW